MRTECLTIELFQCSLIIFQITCPHVHIYTILDLDKLYHMFRVVYYSSQMELAFSLYWHLCSPICIITFSMLIRPWFLEKNVRKDTFGFGFWRCVCAMRARKESLGSQGKKLFCFFLGRRDIVNKHINFKKLQGFYLNFRKNSKLDRTYSWAVCTHGSGLKEPSANPKHFIQATQQA